MFKIPIHSTTDLITNSSTVIFTYSHGCEKPMEEMVNEIFKTFGVDKTFDQVFDSVVLCDDDYKYSEYISTLAENGDTYPEGIDDNTDVSNLVELVKTGKTPKPDWFNTVEEIQDSYDYFLPSTMLYLIPKEKEYEKLGKLITAFLYSTDHEATRDG
jgi:hypothetical protein